MGKANTNGGANDTTNPEPNTNNRSKIMTDALRDFYALDVKIQAMLEKHVKPLRDAKRDIKSKLHEDLNMTATVFNARFISYKAEAKALAAGDESTLDTLRELFAVSPVGSQVDMFVGDSEGAPASA